MCSMTSTYLSTLPAPGEYARFLRKVSDLIRQHGEHAVTRDPLDSFGRSRRLVEIRRDCWRALDRRINIRGNEAWRNTPPDVEMLRDAANINAIRAIRLRVYQIATPKLARRFGHLLASRDD